MLERVKVTARSGRVRITGEARDDLAVEGASVSGSGAEIEVKGGSDAMDLRVPGTTEVIVGAGSGDVTISGTVGPVRITTASADVDADDVAAIDARTTSGRLRVQRCRGDLRLKTTSANVRVGNVDGEVLVSSVSAKIEIGETHGPVAVKNVSGSIEVTVDGTAPVKVETVSGKIVVRVTGGRRPELQLSVGSGNERVEVEPGTDFVLQGRTVSGSITVEAP
jgi:DUF4097 and DUF4098 domain-containing protein YvlB